MEDTKKIKEVIDKLRPFLINDGGDIEFVKYEKNIVYIKMGGACAGCGLIDYTSMAIEEAIMAEVPDVIGVVNINN